MIREIVADVNPEEVRVALLEDGQPCEIHVEMRGKERLVGNIYKGIVKNVLPGMQAAFIDIGLERNAFLYAGDIMVEPQIYTDEEQPEEAKIPNIQDLVKCGQEILVQIVKQPGGTKGARVTTHITLPGRMVVLMPTVDHIGISRRIVDEAVRQELKRRIQEIKPEGMGVIVRTIAEGTQPEDFVEEILFLARLWQRIKDRFNVVYAPKLLHSEESLIFRTLRDIFTQDVDLFIINDKEFYEKALAVVSITMPKHTHKVHFFDKPDNIFDSYNIESKIDKAMQRKVWLKNGSYLVIDEAEALTVIDVNTGKYIGDSDLQETILKVNLEAATAIAHQLRLRAISGIIVIDFIDMESEVSKQRVVEELERLVKEDRIKTTVLGITELGLVQLTRKKVRRKLSASLGTACPCCQGSGMIYSEQTMAMRIRREAVRAANTSDCKNYVVEAPPRVVRYIIGKNKDGQSILPSYENKTFYIKENKYLGSSELRITPAIDGGQIFGDCNIFY